MVNEIEKFWLWLKHFLLCHRTVSTAVTKACDALKRDLDVSKITEGLPDILAITTMALETVEEAALDKLGAVRVEKAIGCLHCGFLELTVICFLSSSKMSYRHPLPTATTFSPAISRHGKVRRMSSLNFRWLLS